ncbi:PrgI family protein [Candidatus Saccharibacteria bacterium]|nr:PrgI family protein [Candidatus Saccharibacteria bacterium]
MAQYKVPQDVEADDKLIGPFSFRQFVYLLIAAGLIAVAVALFQVFPVLAILPVLPALFLAILALPLKKDQPMETYVAALLSYYLKPRTKIWRPGQRESVILITAPKIVEEQKTRDLSEEEATHRLSFLADIVDTEGRAIKGGESSMRDDLLAEANATNDMFDIYETTNLDLAIGQNKEARHAQAIKGMQDAINRSAQVDTSKAAIRNDHGTLGEDEMQKAAAAAEMQKRMESVIVQPGKLDQPPREPSKAAVELANNSDYSVQTIAKEANRIRKDEGEVFISLH